MPIIIFIINAKKYNDTKIIAEYSTLRIIDVGMNETLIYWFVGLLIYTIISIRSLEWVVLLLSFIFQWSLTFWNCEMKREQWKVALLFKNVDKTINNWQFQKFRIQIHRSIVIFRGYFFVHSTNKHTKSHFTKIVYAIHNAV